MTLRDIFFVFVWFFAGLTFAISIGIPNGYGVATSLIFISSISLIYLKPKLLELEEDDKRIIYAFLAFALSMFTFVLIDGFRIRDLDRPSRFILVIPVMLLLLQAKSHQVWLWYGVVIGSIFGFSLAYYERKYLGYMRAKGGEYPIMFGNIGMMLGLLSFVAATFFLSNKRYFWLILSLIGGLCGIGVSVLSASRGGWIALPLIGFFIFWQSRFLLTKKTWLIITLILISLLTSAVLSPQTRIKQRINEAVHDIIQYGDSTHKDTSVGMRFEMWKATWYMFQEAPFLGAGRHSSIVEKKSLIKEKLIDPKILRYGHAHNEFFDSLGYRGIIGLAFLLMVYLIPLRLFMKKINQYKDNWNIKPYAMAGALIPMCYMDFGLTQVMFAHNIGVMMYAFPIVYFWVALRWAEREHLSKI